MHCSFRTKLITVTRYLGDAKTKSAKTTDVDEHHSCNVSLLSAPVSIFSFSFSNAIDKLKHSLSFI